MPRLRSMLAVVLPAALAAPAAAQVTFFDQGFASGWAAPHLVYTSGSTASASTAASGGNSGTVPDPRRDFSHAMSGDILVWHASPFTWTPSTQGAITALQLAADYIVTNSSSNAINFGFAVVQGSTIYRYASSNSPLGGSGWHTFLFSPADLTSASWCAQPIVSGSFHCVGQAPDFSATGGTITFGMATANSGTFGRVNTGAFDDFLVSLPENTAASVAPEPLSLLLLGTGLSGVAAVRRRRTEGEGRAA